MINKGVLFEILENVKVENVLIVYILVDEELCSIVERYCEREGFSCIDLMIDILREISKRIGRKFKREVGIIRKLDEFYFKRVEVIEFVVKYDDGKDFRGVF